MSMASIAFVAVVAGTCCLAMVGAAQAQADRADFNVAPDGKDTNPGTAEKPFATLARAREAVRGEIAAGLGRDILMTAIGHAAGVFANVGMQRHGAALPARGPSQPRGSSCCGNSSTAFPV